MIDGHPTIFDDDFADGSTRLLFAPVNGGDNE